MRQSFLLFLSTSQAFELNNAYLPTRNEYAGHRPLATEYFSYNAPPDDDQNLPLQAAGQLAKALTPPQQVVFIRTPETNLFALTAKQLAARNALDIYVLQRQMDATALAEQKAAIEEQVGHKPTVHFVKYRTPADVSRALSSLRGSYDQLPGRSYSHGVETANVIRLNPPHHIAQPDPVVFKILSKTSAKYDNHEEANVLEAAKLQTLFRQYLPPAERR